MNDTIKYSRSNAVLLGALFLFFLNSSWLGAQTRVTYQDDRDPKYVDVTVTGEGAYLFLTAVGGDGGRKKDAGGHSGGKGAMVSGYVKIGNGAGEIPIGATLRLIPGQAGHSWGLKGGGGGGTGIAFQANSNASWQLLAVAGGGGGAGQHQAGREGTTSTNGSGGLDRNGDARDNGGKDGQGGGASEGAGGGGAYGNGEETNYSGNGINIGGGKQGMDGLVPKGGEGGQLDTTYANSNVPGGFGFGGGGSGVEDGPVIYVYHYGGGGGGYSGGGGGGGGEGGSGGGGGSYLNATFMSMGVKESRGITLSPQDGYVLYQYLSQLPDKAIKFAFNTNKCIDDYGSATSNGNNILSYTCTGNPNQRWYLPPLSRSIRSMVNLEKCLDLTGGNTSNGTNIQLWDCVSGNPNQFWLYNGIHKTIHSGKNSDKCFDATNGSAYPNSNVNIQLWDCNYTSNNMKWTIDGVTTVSNVSNMKHIIPILATGFAVHSHTGAESGSNIQLWTKDNTNTAEQWYFDGLAIKMRDHRDLCIDLSSSNTNNGNNIQLWGCNGTNAQKWIYDGMTRTIRSVVNPDKCMQIEKNTDGAYAKRSNVQIWDCNGSQQQQFLIQE